MKNIRILEDGNRLIVVLEGYERSAVNALIDVLGTAATPLSHIMPHTGEAQFQFKGTEKEILPTKQGQETPIKPPAFMKKMKAQEAGKTRPKTAPKETDGIKEASATPRQEGTAGEATKQEVPKREALTAPGLEIPKQEAPDTTKEMPKQGVSILAKETPEQEAPAAAKKTPGQEETPTLETTSTPDGAAKTVPAKTQTSTKPAEFMNPFELRAYIQQADQGKLSMILRKKGRFPNTAHLLNSDDRTIREYVKELMMTA